MVNQTFGGREQSALCARLRRIQHLSVYKIRLYRIDNVTGIATSHTIIVIYTLESPQKTYTVREGGVILKGHKKQPTNKS